MLLFLVTMTSLALLSTSSTNALRMYFKSEIVLTAEAYSNEFVEISFLCLVLCFKHTHTPLGGWMAELKKQYGACLQAITQGRGQTVWVSATSLPIAGSMSKMSAVCYGACPYSRENIISSHTTSFIHQSYIHGSGCLLTGVSHFF